MTISSMQSRVSGEATEAYGTEIATEAHSRLLLLAEAAILLGAPTLFNWVASVDYVQWPAHPFLFVTILLAAQYGIEGAILAVLGGTLLSWFSGWPERPLDIGYQEFFIALWLQPLTWLAAGVIVGVVTSTRTRQLREKTDQLARSRIAERLISNQFEVLDRRNHKLERTLAGLGPVADEAGTHPTISRQPGGSGRRAVSKESRH
jgi:hypothetical protein